MFHVGKYYKLVTWHSDGGGRTDVSSPSLVIEVSLPLVKFRTLQSGAGESRESIVNTSSLTFVRAELVPDPPHVAPEKPSYQVGKL